MFTLSLDLLGIPDTSLRGLSTRTALRVRKSNSDPTVDRILKQRGGKKKTKAFTEDQYLS